VHFYMNKQFQMIISPLNFLNSFYTSNVRWQFIQIACISVIIVYYECHGSSTLPLMTSVQRRTWLRVPSATANESNNAKSPPHVLENENRHFDGHSLSTLESKITFAEPYWNTKTDIFCMTNKPHICIRTCLSVHATSLIREDLR
jgi:hypothetical protein